MSESFSLAYTDRLGLSSLPMKTASIIAAAGIGARMGFTLPKQYIELGGRPVICHTLDRFREVAQIGELVVVVEPGREGFFKDEILSQFGYPKHWLAIAGGRVRQESTSNGLKVISPDCDVVLIHDGVRPFVTANQIETAIAVAARDGACIVASRINDTVKRAGTDGLIMETVDREYLWGAKTPQVFLRSVITEAFSSAERDGFIGTDEASLVERIGIKVTLVEGGSQNIKITTPEDLIIAEAILKEWKTF